MSQPSIIISPLRYRSSLNLPSSPLSTTDDAIVATISHVPHFPKHRRCILVVARPSELRALSDALSPSELVVVAVDVAEMHECSIRYAAMTYLGSSAVLLVRKGALGDATRILHEIAAAWREPDADVMSVYGAPCVTGDGDAVIPPGWDSEGKIRAVTDASFLVFEEVVHGDWDSPASLGEVWDEEAVGREAAVKVKQVGLKERDVFLEKVKGIAERVGRDEPVANKETVGSATVAHEPAQSDFFQKMLRDSAIR